MSNAQAVSLPFYVLAQKRTFAMMLDMESNTPQGILAANVRKLIGTDSVRNWALTKGLDVRLIDRITKGGNATLKTIDEIANACGVEAWHLLLPEFEPGKAIDQPVSESERHLLERLKKLLG